MNRGEKSTDIGIISNTRRGIKANRKFGMPQPRLVRPQLKPHVCLNESNCLICKDFINKLDEWRGRKK